MSLIIDNSVLSNKPDNDSNEGNTSISDNPNENGKRMKKTRNRPCKSEYYTEEREQIILELEKLIGLNNNKRNATLYELENNSQLINRLKELTPLIKKYYKCSTWGYFSTDPKKGMGCY